MPMRGPKLDFLISPENKFYKNSSIDSTRQFKEQHINAYAKNNVFTVKLFCNNIP